MKIRRFGKAPRRRILLVNPANGDNLWTMGETVSLMGRRALMPCSALATLVALTPPDLGVEYVLCDENVGPIRYDLGCDLVAVTGYSIHSRRIEEICRRYRSRGIPVALGGIHASVAPQAAEHLADHLFVGEAEYTWPRFLREWLAGNAAARYEQKEPVDLADSPPPDWSLLRPADYVYFNVQTTRGCPHGCEFCEVVKVFGRSFRHKPAEQVLQELRNAHALTDEGIFFSDDNFVVNRKVTKDLLRRIVEYNGSQKRPLSFATQATIAIAEDDELLKLLADARFETIFLGVESPRRECLEEVGKQHITRLAPLDAVCRVGSYGIAPIVGLICGFDHDDPTTFDELAAFLEASASPLAVITLLNAPPGTPLYARLAAQRRVNETFDGEWYFATNIHPARMTLTELVRGHEKLLRSLYRPDAFHARVRRWLSHVSYVSSVYAHGNVTWANITRFVRIVLAYVFRAPAEHRRTFFRTLGEVKRINPKLVRPYMVLMTQYWHFFRFVERATWQRVPGGSLPAVEVRASGTDA